MQVVFFPEPENVLIERKTGGLLNSEVNFLVINVSMSKW